MTVREMVLRGRFKPRITNPELPTAALLYEARLLERLSTGTFKLIAAQDVFDDIVLPTGDVMSNGHYARVTQFDEIPHPVPPFEYTWIEARLDSKAIAFCVERVLFSKFNLDNWSKDELKLRDDLVACQPEWVVIGTCIIEGHGNAFEFIYWLDADGRLLGIQVQKSEEHQVAHYLLAAVALHTFARMNCANATLEPLNPRKKKRKSTQGCPATPPTVWHVIKVTDMPSRKAVATTSDPVPVNIRSHWVRGHYADYRNGKGLFGNPKLRVVFWMSEHKRGDPAVGEVQANYEIEKASHAA